MKTSECWPVAETAGDLTTEHYGLLVSWQPPVRDDGFLPPRRTVVCDELRRWVYRGQRRVEISDMTPDGGFVGRAYHLDAETPITIERRVRKARKRAWGKGAMKPGETWADAEARTPGTTGEEQDR